MCHLAWGNSTAFLVKVVPVILIGLLVHMQLEWFEHQLPRIFFLRVWLNKWEFCWLILRTLLAEYIGLKALKLLLTHRVGVVVHEVRALDRLHG